MAAPGLFRLRKYVSDEQAEQFSLRNRSWNVLGGRPMHADTVIGVADSICFRNVFKHRYNSAPVRKGQREIKVHFWLFDRGGMDEINADQCA